MKRFTLILTILVGLMAVPVWAAEMDKMDTMDSMKTEGRAILAGGCFWCVESGLEKLDGVKEVVSGYTGGNEMNPTYQQVSSGSTGHTEAVEVLYDPDKISYAELLDAFWMIMDPTDAGGQFVDRGSQYRSGIFYLTEEQRIIAEKSKRKLAETGPFDKPIVTEIVQAGKFYPAEDYHQDYYKKNPVRYWLYTNGSGRKEFTERYWGTMEK